MKKRSLYNFLFLFLLSLSVLTPFAFLRAAQDTSTNTGITYECVSKDANGNTIYGNCDYNDLIAATKNVINTAIKYALFFSVIVIAYAGWRYMTSGDNAGERAKANKMLWSVAKGIVFVLAAWLIVTLIMNTLVSSSITGNASYPLANPKP